MQVFTTHAAELVQIPVSHRGSQTSASFFPTATKSSSATSAQRHRGFKPYRFGHFIVVRSRSLLFAGLQTADSRLVRSRGSLQNTLRISVCTHYASGNLMYRQI